MNKARYRRNYKGPKEKIRRAILAKNMPEKKILWGIKSKCKKLNIPFNIDESDIVIPEICPVLGLKLQHGHGLNHPLDSSPSLDRKIPCLGYVKGNVRVISHRANLLKSNATIEELTLVLEDLKKLR